MQVEMLLEKVAKKYGEKPAVIFNNTTLTFAQLRNKVLKLSNGLGSLGIKKGDKVAVCLPNCPEYVVSYLAIFSIGAVVVPLDLGLKNELVNCLRHADAKILIIKNAKQVELASIMKTVPTLEKVLVCEDNLPKIIEQASDTPVHATINDQDDSVIFYTTGTTGQPKGVLWNYRNLDNASKTMGYFVKLNAGDVKLCAIPFSHCAGLVYIQNCIFFGITMILMERFAPIEFVENIQKYKVTCFHIVPAMFEAILNLKQIEHRTLPTIRWVAVFGAPSAPSLIKRFEKLCPNGKTINGYGLTETSPPTVVPPLDKIKSGSVGTVPPWVEMTVLDNDGKSLPVGEIGEVALKGWIVAQGYYKAPELTKTVTKNGWFCTGDLGRIDKNNYLYIVGRKKQMIIVGGLSVYPDEIEFVLSEHPGIKEVAVIGISDKLRGEAVKAIIVPKSGASINREEITAYCRQRLAKFKIPRIIEFTETLPRVGIGKVAKEALK